MPLTKRQKEILDFLRQFVEENEYSPSYQEICREFGFTSLATVHEHVSNLERKGYIRKAFGESRSIALPDQEPSIALPDHESSVSLPLLGTVAAGEPIEAVQDDETMTVPTELVRSGRQHFVLRVSGQSMIDEQIRDGDCIVVAAQETAQDGETVVALVDEHAATVKKLYREAGGRIRLQPANPSMDALVVPGNTVRVQGVVVGLIRRF